MNIRLDGKNALVCGGSKGIGRAIGGLLAHAGANVTLLARNENDLLVAINQLDVSNNQRHDCIVCDMNDNETLKNSVAEKISEYGAYNILINNTAGPEAGLLYKSKPEQLEAAFNQHVVSAQALLSVIAQPMMDSGYGRIINIISIGLKQPIENLGISNTIRGAMGSWAKTLAAELGKFGITVNNILPGYTNTERLNHLIEFRSRNENIKKNEVIERINNQVPMGRMATPNEIAYPVLFLASEFASYVNGVNFPVDGGFLKTL
jgi:3-oxoacyl-[acyl-carrier protein] reductase